MIGFCAGVLVLILILPDDTNELLPLNHVIESPGKLSVTVHMRESNSPPLGDTCGPVRVIVGGTKRKKKEINCISLS